MRHPSLHSSPELHRQRPDGLAPARLDLVRFVLHRLYFLRDHRFRSARASDQRAKRNVRIKRQTRSQLCHNCKQTRAGEICVLAKSAPSSSNARNYRMVAAGTMKPGIICTTPTESITKRQLPTYLTLNTKSLIPQHLTENQLNKC